MAGRCLHKKATGKHRQSHRGNSVWWQTQRLGWCVHKPRNTKSFQPLPEARKRSIEQIHPQKLRKKPTLQTHWFQTSRPQNLEKKFVVFKPPKFVVICSGSPGKPIHLSSQHSLPPTLHPKPRFSQEDPCGSMELTCSCPSWLRPVSIFHLPSP